MSLQSNLPAVLLTTSPTPGLIPASPLATATPPSDTSSVVSVPDSCQLVDAFGIIIQLFMAVAALSTLLVKRWYESPRRPVMVWFFDASKQALAAGFVHMLNILISFIFGTNLDPSVQDQCVWYFLNLLVDSTAGVFIIFLLMRFTDAMIDRSPMYLRDLRTGNYGTPPSIIVFAKQVMVYIVVVIIMKAAVTLMLQAPFWFTIGRTVLAPMQANPHLKALVVLVLFPLVCNAFQFWIQDNILKSNDDFSSTTLSGKKKIKRRKRRDSISGIEDDDHEGDRHIMLHDEYHSSSSASSSAPNSGSRSLQLQQQQHHNELPSSASLSSSNSSSSAIFLASLSIGTAPHTTLAANVDMNGSSELRVPHSLSSSSSPISSSFSSMSHPVAGATENQFLNGLRDAAANIPASIVASFRRTAKADHSGMASGSGSGSVVTRIRPSTADGTLFGVDAAAVRYSRLENHDSDIVEVERDQYMLPSSSSSSSSLSSLSLEASGTAILAAKEKSSLPLPPSSSSASLSLFQRRTSLGSFNRGHRSSIGSSNSDGSKDDEDDDAR